MASGEASADGRSSTVTRCGEAEDDGAELRRMVGKRVRTGRVWAELSQDELAAHAGVTRNFVSAIERGAQGLDATRLIRLAKAINLTIGQLLDPDPTRLPPSWPSDQTTRSGR